MDYANILATLYRDMRNATIDSFCRELRGIADSLEQYQEEPEIAPDDLQECYNSIWVDR